MGYSLQFGWLYEALGAIASGAAMTVFLIAVTTVIGTVISIAGAAARRSRYRPLRQAITAYVELVRNTPFLVQLFFIFFGLPSIGVRLDPIIAAMTGSSRTPIDGSPKKMKNNCTRNGVLRTSST